MIKTIILLEKSTFKKSRVCDGEIDRFDNNGSEKFAKKSRISKSQKLSKSRKSKSEKSAKSKKLSKNRNLQKFATRKAGPGFLTSV